MRRSTLLTALLLVLVTVVASPLVFGEEPEKLQLEKGCAIIGRIQGTDVLLYPQKEAGEPARGIPVMGQIGGFEVLNTISGEWQPLTLDKEGYFCVSVGMGQYDLRGRDCEGRPYLIHRFNVPLHMAVNLGNFWVDTCNPASIGAEGWEPYARTAGWREYRQGEGRISVRLEHITSRDAYEECENWFSECHEDAWRHFEKVTARR